MILNFEPRGFEPCDSCFKNQNKIGFNRYNSCRNRIIRPNVVCYVFSRLQMVVLNDFVLFLKQESGSRAQGWKAREKAYSTKICTSIVNVQVWHTLQFELKEFMDYDLLFLASQ